MPSWIIDGEQSIAQQIVLAPTCTLPDGSRRGKCVIIANNSPSDTLYFASDQVALQNAKAAGSSSNPIGTPILAQEKLIIPWVTTALYAINYNSGATPTDEMSVEAWE